MQECSSEGRLCVACGLQVPPRGGGEYQVVAEGVRVWEKVWVMCEQERCSPAFYEAVRVSVGM